MDENSLNLMNKVNWSLTLKSLPVATKCCKLFMKTNANSILYFQSSIFLPNLILFFVANGRYSWNWIAWPPNAFCPFPTWIKHFMEKKGTQYEYIRRCWYFTISDHLSYFCFVFYEMEIRISSQFPSILRANMLRRYF